jgi:hypothetical protein
VQKDEFENKTDVRVLLYRSIQLNREFSAYILKAITSAKVDPQLLEVSAEVEKAPPGALNHSARSSSGLTKESARSFATRGNQDTSRTAVPQGLGAYAVILLNNNIKVDCMTDDFDVLSTEDADSTTVPTDAASAMTHPFPSTYYDKNGHAQLSSTADLDGTLTPKMKAKAPPKEDRTGGFSSAFEDGSNSTELVDLLAKSFSPLIADFSSKQAGKREVSPPDMISKDNVVRREFKIVITVTGKWVREGKETKETTKKSPTELKSNLSTPGGSPRSVEESTPLEIPTIIPTFTEPIKPVPMSLRMLIRKNRDFCLAETGKSYLHSHKEKMRETARLNKTAAEELKR